MGIGRAFSEPVIIILSWMILIIGVINAANLIGAKMPTDGVAGGIGDLFRNA